MEGYIFNIQKFCLHDGPGIRTTVFFKGCNLRCRWCANPESQQMDMQLTLDRRKCIGCGVCVTVCPSGARTLSGGILSVEEEKCTQCGGCVPACPAEAIAVEGKCVSLEQVEQEVMKDKPFYDTSGGGVTLSGGEVLLQLPFAVALARGLREKGVHVAIETAAGADLQSFAALLGEIDYVLMDLKHYDSAAHRAGTGRDNTQVLANLQYLAKSGKPYLVRIPVIPGFNDSLEDAAGFAAVLKDFGVKVVELLPFHQLGQHKYGLLGMPYAYEGCTQLHPEDLDGYADVFLKQGIRVKR